MSRPSRRGRALLAFASLCALVTMAAAVVVLTTPQQAAWDHAPSAGSVPQPPTLHDTFDPAGN